MNNTPWILQSRRIPIGWLGLIVIYIYGVEVLSSPYRLVPLAVWLAWWFVTLTVSRRRKR